MKHLKIAVLAAAATVLLTACTDRSDIESDIFAAGLAADRGKEKKYLISAEVITTEDNENGASVGSKIIGAEGETVLEAINAMVAETSKKLNFDHCSVLILSPEVAREDLYDVLDIAFRDSDLRLSMQTLVSKGCAAREILQSSGTANIIKSYEISETVKINRNGSAAAVYRLLNGLNGIAASAAVPVFTLKSGESDEKTNILDGTAIFKNGGFVGFTDSDCTVFALMAAGRFGQGTVSCFIPSADTLMTVYVRSCRRKVETETDDDTAHVHISLEIDVDLPEIPSSIDLSDSGRATVTESDIENYFSQNVYAVVTDTLNRYGADIFGLSSKLLAGQRHFCRRNADRFEDVLRTLKITVSCSVKIRGSGVTDSRIIEDE